jgi:hypothetical protein
MEKLKQILAQEDTVLFIGSGISLWSGLPSWSGMIEELAQFIELAGEKADLVRAEAQRGDLLQAASYGFDKLTTHQIGVFIRAACHYGIAKPHEIHQKIVLLGPRCFVTTNYDDLIEQSLRKWQPDRFYPTPVTNRHLCEIPKRVERERLFMDKIEWNLEYNLPLTDVHEPYLRTLIPQADGLGAAAVSRLVEMKGAEVKDEFLQLLVDYLGDYNFCSSVGSILMPFAREEDAKKIVVWADFIQANVTPDSDEDETSGFTSGAARFLAKLDLSIIRREFLPQDESVKIPEIHARILCGILEDHSTTDALNFAGELLLRGVENAGFAIYFISRIARQDYELSWASFTEAHIDYLGSLIGYSSESWELSVLECICEKRPDLAEIVRQRASMKSGLEKAALLNCVSPEDFTPIYQALVELVEMSNEGLQEQSIHILQQIQINWAGKEELFVQLLRVRDMQLASAIMGNSIPSSLLNLGHLEIGSIDWWLEWMMEMWNPTEFNWVPRQLGALFGEHLSSEVQDQFVTEFSKSNSRFRRILMHCVLPYYRDLTTDAFSEDAISFLLSDLNREGSAFSYRDHLLGRTATEQFVTERLLPLLPDAKQPLLKNIL